MRVELIEEMPTDKPLRECTSNEHWINIILWGYCWHCEKENQEKQITF